MNKTYFLAVLTALLPFAANAASCTDPGYHWVNRTQCCPANMGLNAKGQCAYPTQNGCPAGMHPQGENACCPIGAKLTPDGYCTEMHAAEPGPAPAPARKGVRKGKHARVRGGGYTSNGDSGWSPGSTHPCFTSITGTEAADVYSECSSMGGQASGVGFNGKFWTGTCQYGCQQ